MIVVGIVINRYYYLSSSFLPHVVLLKIKISSVS